jgi:SAM-dependent methyltransferase
MSFVLRPLIGWARAVVGRLPKPAASFLQEHYRRFALRRSLREHARLDPQVMQAWGIETAPPPALRLRVHGAADLQSFLVIGRENFQTIVDGLALAGKPVGSESRILDFGCGPGRTLHWWMQHQPRPILHGTDIDREAVDWARQNLPVSLAHNEPRPPLPYADAAFDVIYSISVFTHLDEQYQDAWLAELRRVLKPDGVALLSVRSEQDLASRPAALQERVRREGIVFEHDTWTAQFFPGFYQATYHSAGYIDRHWGRVFKVVGRVTRGYVDLMVLRRK